MNKNFVSKVLLSLYKSIPQCILCNEKAVIKRSKFEYSYRRVSNTILLYEEILNLNAEKINLINLKTLIDKAFDLLLDEDRKFLYLRFVKNYKFVDIARRLDVSMRQVFRMYDTAVNSFQTQLEYLKYPAERIEEEFGQLSIYKSVSFRLGNEFGKLE
ncbi:MAG: hypothetical protein RR357_01005 [Clostridia bacterium]